MKYVFSLFFSLVLVSLTAQQQRHCALEELLTDAALQYPAELQQFLDISDQSIFQHRNLITLPVVIHVVYTQEENNISDFQILTQLEILNQSFQGEIPLDAEILRENRVVSRGVGVEFKLACTDPDGNSTTGITRTRSDIPNIGFAVLNNRYAVHHDGLGGHDPWPTSDYINIWVAEMDEDFLGRSSLPAPLSDPNQDGVVISTKNFGYGGLAFFARPYHLGRTLVHEIGHYLGLLHPWGAGSGDCETDDQINDTPNQSEIYYDCPNESQSTSCGSSDMTKNFMGYVDDPCLQYFTQGQTNRMLNTLNGYRIALLSSPANTDCGLLKNTNEQMSLWHHIENRDWIARFPTTQDKIEIEIFNLNGQRVRRFDTENSDLLHINLDETPAGLYIALFSFDKKTETRKITVY